LHSLNAHRGFLDGRDVVGVDVPDVVVEVEGAGVVEFGVDVDEAALEDMACILCKYNQRLSMGRCSC